MVSVVVVWKYQSYKYEATLLEISNKSLQAQQKAQQEVLEKERVNQDAISDLNKRNADNTKNSAMRCMIFASIVLSTVGCSSNPVVVQPVCQLPPPPPTVLQTKAGIEIPREFSNFLTEALSKADQCEVDLNTAKEYGKLIEKFRKDNTK